MPESEHHIRRPFKKANIFFPAYPAFTMLQTGPMNCCFIFLPQFGQTLLLFPIVLNIQTVFVQKEIIYAHNQDPILIVMRCRSVLGDDNPLEEISGQHQRTLFLLHLCLIHNRVCGLDIVAFGAFVANKVNLQLFTDAVALFVGIIS